MWGTKSNLLVLIQFSKSFRQRTLDSCVCSDVKISNYIRTYHFLGDEALGQLCIDAGELHVCEATARGDTQIEERCSGSGKT